MIWSVLSQFKWLLLFLQHRGRGRRTRLSIRTKDPNNHSDTETGTLSNLLDFLETIRKLPSAMSRVMRKNFPDAQNFPDARKLSGWQRHDATMVFVPLVY